MSINLKDVSGSKISKNNGDCAACGRSTLKSSLIKSSDRSQSCEKLRREQDTFWIQCDHCDCWYHGRCVNVEEYESALIEKYHCERCAITQGPTIMKKALLDHRYAFDDISQQNEPTQIGTKRFIDEFKKTSEQIPIAGSEHLTCVSNGYEFMQNFNHSKAWHNVYLIANPEGLGIQLPSKDFSLKDCVDVVGENRMVDTIDVYKQYTFQMSFGRFYEHFVAEERPRLYNILSLEFSDSKLSEFVQPPKLVADLSWVHKFWPQNKKDSTPVSAMITSRTVFNEHLRAKPEVELFCLVGMKDSYTDFHIDFGGSSVWYHVFKGRKVFYVVAPLERNLQAFSNYQNMANRTEVFFGDLIAPGQLFKVIINEGETLMIPSGWIHAVWTPCDSLVFGGNFLHSLNIEMQLRIYEMETSLETEDRFMFPSFELVNWYAAVSILSKFKEANLHGTIIDGWLLTGTKALLVSLKRWISRDEATDGDISDSQWYKVYRKLKRNVHFYEKKYRLKTTATGITTTTYDCNSAKCESAGPQLLKKLVNIYEKDVSSPTEQLVTSKLEQSHKGNGTGDNEDVVHHSQSRTDGGGNNYGLVLTKRKRLSGNEFDCADDEVGAADDCSTIRQANERWNHIAGATEANNRDNNNNDTIRMRNSTKMAENKNDLSEENGKCFVKIRNVERSATPILPEEQDEVQTSLLSMFSSSKRSVHGRQPKPSQWVTSTVEITPPSSSSCNNNIDAPVGTPTAKKFPPPHEEFLKSSSLSTGSLSSSKVQHQQNVIDADNTNINIDASSSVKGCPKKPEMDQNNTGSVTVIKKKKTPTTARQRLARKLKIRF